MGRDKAYLICDKGGERFVQFLDDNGIDCVKSKTSSLGSTVGHLFSKFDSLFFTTQGNNKISEEVILRISHAREIGMPVYMLYIRKSTDTVEIYDFGIHKNGTLIFGPNITGEALMNYEEKMENWRRTLRASAVKELQVIPDNVSQIEVPKAKTKREKRNLKPIEIEETSTDVKGVKWKTLTKRPTKH